MPRPNWIDDPAILDDAIVWHGVPSRQIVSDPATGLQRPSPGTFSDREPSINLASLTTAAAVIQKGQSQGVQWRLWEMRVGHVRALHLWVDSDPQLDDPSHCVIIRDDAPGTKYLKESQTKKLTQIGYWQDVGPPVVALAGSA